MKRRARRKPFKAKMWMNVYDDRFGGAYKTRQIAREYAATDLIRVMPVMVTEIKRRKRG